MSNITISPAGVFSAPINPIPARIAGFDLARAFALLGMVCVNFRYLMDTDEYESIWLLRLSDWLDGRPAVTFVILAGIGLSGVLSCVLSCEAFERSGKLAERRRTCHGVARRA